MADPLRRVVRARVLRAVGACARFLPRSVAGAFLRCLAHAARLTRFETAIKNNLERAMGSTLSPSQRRKIAREVRLFSARLIEEWLFLARASASGRSRAKVEAWIRSNVAFDRSCEPIFEAARAGRGLLIATAHLGNWELLATALRLRGLDGAVVGLRKHRDPSSDWLVAMRAGLGVRTIPQDAPPREILGVLRSGATLGILCDLEVRRLAGMHVPFFGIEALTQTAPAALSRASRLPIHPVRIVARGRGYLILAEEALKADASLAREAATADVLRRLNAVYERWIREDPSQWAWHQPRWRTGPGEREAPPLHSRRGAAE